MGRYRVMERGKAKVTRAIFKKGSALTRRINGILKANNIAYDYNPLISRAYNGEGFYVDSVKLSCNKPIKTYGYDIHWCYGGALFGNYYPLTSRVSRKNETSLYIMMIEFESIEERYKDFNYTLYRNCIINLENTKAIIMTNVDYVIFTDMYIIKGMKVVDKTYFQDIGTLPEELKELAKKVYELKKKGLNKEEKIVLESSFYGKFAQKMNKHKYGTFRQRKKYEKAFAKTGYEEVRDERTPIAMYQAAYQRLREYLTFKRLMDDILYMNTDSVMCEKDPKIPTGEKIGDWGKEYDGNPIYYIRRNAYIVFDNNGKILKKVIGGIPMPEDNEKIKKMKLNRIDDKSIKKLQNGESLEMYMIDDKSKTGFRKTTLSPLFYYYGS